VIFPSVWLGKMIYEIVMVRNGFAFNPP